MKKLNHIHIMNEYFPYKTRNRLIGYLRLTHQENNLTLNAESEKHA